MIRHRKSLALLHMVATTPSAAPTAAKPHPPSIQPLLLWSSLANSMGVLPGERERLRGWRDTVRRGRFTTVRPHPRPLSLTGRGAGGEGNRTKRNRPPIRSPGQGEPGRTAAGGRLIIGATPTVRRRRRIVPRVSRGWAAWVGRVLADGRFGNVGGGRLHIRLETVQFAKIPGPTAPLSRPVGAGNTSFHKGGHGKGDVLRGTRRGRPDGGRVPRGPHRRLPVRVGRAGSWCSTCSACSPPAWSGSWDTTPCGT